MKALTEKQEASAKYIVEQLTPIQGDEAIAARMAEIHAEPGREPGPDCGCRVCVEATNGETS
jgi:hypothetical protein